MISYIIPTNGKRPESLRMLIDSILTASIKKPEIIIVGPTNNIQIPKGCIMTPAQRETEETRIGSKINMGMEAASHDIRVHVHDDMLVHPLFEKYLSLNGFFEAMWYGSVDIIGPNYLYKHAGYFGIDESAHEPREAPLWTLGPKGHRPISIDEWDDYSYVSGEAIIITKRAWKQCPWSDVMHSITRGSALAYDVEFGLRANRLGLKTAFDPNVCLYHLRLPSTVAE